MAPFVAAVARNPKPPDPPGIGNRVGRGLVENGTCVPARPPSQPPGLPSRFQAELCWAASARSLARKGLEPGRQRRNQRRASRLDAAEKKALLARSRSSNGSCTQQLRGWPSHSTCQLRACSWLNHPQAVANSSQAVRRLLPEAVAVAWVPPPATRRGPFTRSSPGAATTGSARQPSPAGLALLRPACQQLGVGRRWLWTGCSWRSRASCSPRQTRRRHPAVDSKGL